MATSQDFITYVIAQMERAGYLRTRKMFGEYAIYRHDKVIAFAADNALLFKDTPGGREVLKEREITLGELFPGARPSLVIDDIDDEELLVQLAIETDKCLPPPKPKRPRRKTGHSSPGALPRTPLKG